MSVCQRNTESRPPAVEIAATATADAADARRSSGCPIAVEHCSIAIDAAANASTAARVCTKSWSVKAGPMGTGQPGVHGTFASTRKNPHATPSATDGAQSRRIGARLRMPRQVHATSAPPPTSSSSAIRNAAAVGIPSAPSPLT